MKTEKITDIYDAINYKKTEVRDTTSNEGI